LPTNLKIRDGGGYGPHWIRKSDSLRQRRHGTDGNSVTIFTDIVETRMCEDQGRFDLLVPIVDLWHQNGPTSKHRDTFATTERRDGSLR
jgi:hypothetical protein